jgi:hypothetical protein
MVTLKLMAKYIKDFSKKDVVYLLTILVLLMYVFRGYLVHTTSNNDVVTKPALKPTTQMKDKNGNSYTEVQGTLFTEKEMKHVTDSLSKVLGKGKVVHVVETVTVIDTEYKIEDVYIDTLNGFVSAQDSNKNSQISFNGNYRLKTGSFRLRLSPDTSTYVTSIKTHWFKADNMTVNIYHTNELFVPSMGAAYTAKVPKTVACIGPVTGIAYGAGKIYPFVGLGITLNVFGIKIKK